MFYIASKSLRFFFLGKETADLNSLNVQLHEALVQLKNLKANYIYTANELDNLRFQREQIEKDLDDVSRYRYFRLDSFCPFMLSLTIYYTEWKTMTI